jgi:hypothetical protein
MGLLWASILGLAGFALGLFVFSGFGLPSPVALAGAAFTGSYGIYLGGKI